MSKRLKIIVRASRTHPDLLTIQDAMQQVLDLFDLASAEDEYATDVVWNLVSATTNTPLTVVAEAVSVKEGVDAAIVAIERKRRLATGLSDVSEGRMPSGWTQPNTWGIAQKIFRRSLNGVGTTDIIFDDEDEKPLVITPRVAKTAIAVLEPPAALMEVVPDETLQREEMGTVEGVLLDCGHDYNQPAIKIKERLTGREVWCRVSEELRDKIAKETNFNDVWQHRRVRVRGRILYRDSQIVRIFVQDVEPVSTRRVDLDEIRDEDFTSGLPIAEYLEKLREGEID